MAKIKVANAGVLQGLLSATDYQKLVDSEAKH